LNCADSNGFNSAALASVAVIVAPIVAGAAFLAFLAIAGGGAAAAVNHYSDENDSEVNTSPIYNPAVVSREGLV
jgi:hypothetical protein